MLLSCIPHHDANFVVVVAVVIVVVVVVVVVNAVQCCVSVFAILIGYDENEWPRGNASLVR